MSDHADTIRRVSEAEAALDALLAERQQLRQALEQITALSLFQQGNGLAEARRIARDALADRSPP